jgi:hypothetical protein
MLVTIRDWYLPRADTYGFKDGQVQLAVVDGIEICDRNSKSVACILDILSVYKLAIAHNLDALVHSGREGHLTWLFALMRDQSQAAASSECP